MVSAAAARKTVSVLFCDLADSTMLGERLDPEPLRERGVQPLDRTLHVERGPHRPEGIVLVYLRETEHRHHRVADELLHDAAVALDGDPHLLVPPAQELT